jgi:hypothetical protein
MGCCWRGCGLLIGRESCRRIVCMGGGICWGWGGGGVLDSALQIILGEVKYAITSRRALTVTDLMFWPGRRLVSISESVSAPTPEIATQQDPASPPKT